MTIIKVAAGVITKDNKFLLSGRHKHEFYNDCYEFPGGKLEKNESPKAALMRELNEELGIKVKKLSPLINYLYHYPHISVHLHIFIVEDFYGEIKAQENQALKLVTKTELSAVKLLPANKIIVNAIKLPRIYWLTPYIANDNEYFTLVKNKLAQGIKFFCFRQKPILGTEQFKNRAIETLQLAKQHNANMLINSDYKLAHDLGCGAHLTSEQLLNFTLGDVSAINPAQNILAASCHNDEEIARAIKLGLDFITISPIKATLSHQEAVPLGFAKMQDLIQEQPILAYALGGIKENDLGVAKQHGAFGAAGHFR